MDHLSIPFDQPLFSNTENTKALDADLLFGPDEMLSLGQRHLGTEEVSEALKMYSVSGRVPMVFGGS